MVQGMQQMTPWHTQSFFASPIGDGYEVEVNEFDYRDDNGICYDKNGVTVRHWRRSHEMDGASATGSTGTGSPSSGRVMAGPTELSIELSQGVDVFVTEIQPDMAQIRSRRAASRRLSTTRPIDHAHTDPLCLWLHDQAGQPAHGLVTHLPSNGPRQ